MARNTSDHLYAALETVAKRYQASFERKEFTWAETDIDPSHENVRCDAGTEGVQPTVLGT